MTAVIPVGWKYTFSLKRLHCMIESCLDCRIHNQSKNKCRRKTANIANFTVFRWTHLYWMNLVRQRVQNWSRINAAKDVKKHDLGLSKRIIPWTLLFLLCWFYCRCYIKGLQKRSFCLRCPQPEPEQSTALFSVRCSSGWVCVWVPCSLLKRPVNQGTNNPQH